MTFGVRVLAIATAQTHFRPPSEADGTAAFSGHDKLTAEQEYLRSLLPENGSVHACRSLRP